MTQEIAIRFTEWTSWNYERLKGHQNQWLPNFGEMPNRSLHTNEVFESFKASDTYKELAAASLPAGPESPAAVGAERDIPQDFANAYQRMFSIIMRMANGAAVRPEEITKVSDIAKGINKKYATDGPRPERSVEQPAPREAVEPGSCQCPQSIKTGQTSVMCCNICGLPDEPGWQPKPNILAAHAEGQQGADSAGVWVKCSDRLPKEHKHHICRWISSKKYADMGDFSETLYRKWHSDRFPDIEWLDESPSFTPSEKAEALGREGFGDLLEFYFEEFPHNKPLYKDSGLWQLRSDSMDEVIVQQGVNESFADFIERCKLIKS